MARFFEDASFQAEEFDLGVDVEVLGLHGVGGLFDHTEGTAIIPLADCEFNCVEGEKKAKIKVYQLDGLKLRQDVFYCYFIVAVKY